jgi:CHAT domain-containing protein
MIAGSKSALLSLWKVDDKATAELMLRFYRLLNSGLEKYHALMEVQKEFRSDPKLKSKGWNSPYYWAAWQLVGDWRPIKGL